MIYGYARVSTVDQNPALQMDALDAAGCERVFIDHASGAQENRPELTVLLDTIAAGDVLTVWRFDRLGRSLAHLLELVAQLEAKGAHLRSLTEGIDTAGATGKLFFSISGAFAEFERSLIIERTNAGLAAAKARGQRLGRRPVVTPDKLRTARRLIEAGESVSSAARSLSVSRSALYAALRA